MDHLFLREKSVRRKCVVRKGNINFNFPFLRYIIVDDLRIIFVAPGLNLVILM